MDTAVFYIFGAIAIFSSLFVVAQGNPMHSVMLLITSFGALAGLYVLLDAPFTAVTQIIIYAGAIMVLFLFVVMLLNIPREDPVAATGVGAAWTDRHAFRCAAVRLARPRGGLGAVANGRRLVFRALDDIGQFRRAASAARSLHDMPSRSKRRRS